MEDLSVHDRVVERLFDRLYDRPIIDNVDRGVYVEYMIEWALQRLDPAWKCMPGWSMWDLENKNSGARIEVKQSAMRQTWSQGSELGSTPRFGIAPTKSFWDDETATWMETEPQRWADLYIFAFHPECDEEAADHRLPEQWEFYLVPERLLPPLQKSIGLNPVRSMGLLTGFGHLGSSVTRVIAEIPRLKVEHPLL